MGSSWCACWSSATARLWQPVYLDDVSAVFVRRGAPGAEDLIQRFPVSCANRALARILEFGAVSHPRSTLTANAAAVLAILGRNSEALTATDSALAIFPDSSFAHWLRGNLLAAMNPLRGSARGIL